MLAITIFQIFLIIKIIFFLLEIKIKLIFIFIILVKLKLLFINLMVLSLRWVMPVTAIHRPLAHHGAGFLAAPGGGTAVG